MAGATLSEDVTLDVDGDAIEIASGTVLPAVLIQDDGAERFVHCTRSRIGVSGNTQGGMFGGLLVQAIESLSDAQTCLEDTDSDGLLDTAFVLGRGPRDMLMIGGIEPVDFETGTFLPVEGEEDYLRIRLDRVGRRRVDLDVDIVVQGRGIQFDSLRTGRYLLTPRVFLDFENGQEKPAATEIFGMVFEVFASDRRADQASLRWYPEVPEEEMVVVPNEMTTRYY